MYGYHGKILHIDLAERKHWVEEKPEEWYKIYIGGVSMASRLCWENITPGCDPYSPENPVCFANGILLHDGRYKLRKNFSKLNVGINFFSIDAKVWMLLD